MRKWEGESRFGGLHGQACRGDLIPRHGLYKLNFPPMRTPIRQIILPTAFLLILITASGGLAELPAPFTDTRGPVINAGMKVQVDHEGVQAPGYVWTRPESKTNWSAQWIGVSTPATGTTLANCLRKEVTLDQTPKRVTAWLTADNYLLYINGKPAARGPSDPGKDYFGGESQRHFYEVRDLTPLFHKGTNAISAELLGCNKLLFEALVEYPDGKTVTITSDPTWKGIDSPYLKMAMTPAQDSGVVGGGPAVLFDATAEPTGWLLPNFDDSSWPTCTVVPAPPQTLVVSELPPLMEVRYPYFNITNVVGNVSIPDEPLQPGHPITVQGSGQFTLHFDKIMAGRCGIKVKGSKGARLYLVSNETSDPQGARLYEVQLRDGEQSFESRDYYALGSLTVIVRDAAQPVEIEDVSADFLSQPIAYQGSFSCSDEALNKLWKSGRWSTQICMITHHLDSPQHQEPISDYGDYLIADLVNYYTMGNNPWLAKQDLIKWTWVMENEKYHTFHTSYMFYWLQSLVNYYEFTGDKALVQELAPSVHAMIDQFTSYIGTNGIISQAPNYMFMDWVAVHDDKNPSIQFACHHPPAVIGQGYMTALFYGALSDGIKVAKITDDPARAEKYEALRKQILEAYNKELWNGDRGMYRDGKPFVTTIKPYDWMPADVQMESFSVQNNANAVLHDLAPTNAQAAIIENMMANKNWDVTPYFMHFVFDSLDHAGLFEKYGVAKMHEYKVIPETQTVREMGPEKGDYSHGWIASPTYQMSSKILGIKPTSPGFATLEIKPELCGLTWAKGTVPTPHGKVAVSWKQEMGKFTLEATVPKGTTAQIAVPTTGYQTDVQASGVRFLKLDQGRAIYEAGPGSYIFIAKN